MRRRVFGHLFAVDALTVLFSGTLALLAFASAARGFAWRTAGLASAAIAIGLPLLAAARRRWPTSPLAFVHDWAFAPLAYVIYLDAQRLIEPIRGASIADPTLIALDRWLFGADPAVLLAGWASPGLTELLQVAYTSFYGLLVLVAAELYVKGDRERFRFFSFACALGFFMSFVGYLAVPAVGPRFTLYDVATVERELPGLLLTPSLRAFVDGGGLVPPGLTQAAAAALAPRDVFPSGHTMLTLVAMYWTWRFRLAVRWGVWPTGALLVFATVYLRYHYRVDVLAGAMFAGVCVVVTPAVHRWFCQKCASSA